MGAKGIGEWGRFVKESAKMMKRVDPTIELLAASIADVDWNHDLLREAGSYLRWVSIHGYWDRTNEVNNLSSYETCMAYTLEIEAPILKTKHILGALGYLGRIRIAYDEWNLRGWHHPYVHANEIGDDYLSARDKNDINASYTMADAVFSACFLNQCLKHCDVVGMANFAPTVNTRGAIFTHQDGIVLRSTYFVFELYTKYMGDEVVDLWIQNGNSFEVERDGELCEIPNLDVMATKTEGQEDLRVAIVNRHPDKKQEIELNVEQLTNWSNATLYSVVGDSKDAFNDVDCTMVRVEESQLSTNFKNDLWLEIAPHSVNVWVLT